MDFPEIEKASTEEIKNLQEKLLQETLSYVSQNSAYYKALFEKENINIENIKTIEDLQQLPVTTKDDLQKNNDDFCVFQGIKLLIIARLLELWAIR